MNSRTNNHIWVTASGLLSLTLFIFGCGAPRKSPSPHHHPFFQTQWHQTDSPKKSRETKKKDAETPGRLAKMRGADIRQRIVESAIALEREGKAERHFGANDIETIFRNAGFPNCWKATPDAAQIAKTATKLNAWRKQKKPKKGDILLFHNQFDRNRNGQSDDWFTGAAIVIQTGTKTHIAITRTEGAPRRIHVSPAGPMIYSNGEEPKNSFVRVPGPHDPVDAQYLSGQLYAGAVDSEEIVARLERAR